MTKKLPEVIIESQDRSLNFSSLNFVRTYRCLWVFFKTEKDKYIMKYSVNDLGDWIHVPSSHKHLPIVYDYHNDFSRRKCIRKEMTQKAFVKKYFNELLSV